MKCQSGTSFHVTGFEADVNRFKRPECPDAMPFQRVDAALTVHFISQKKNIKLEIQGWQGGNVHFTFTCAKTNTRNARNNMYVSI